MLVISLTFMPMTSLKIKKKKENVLINQQEKTQCIANYATALP